MSRSDVTGRGLAPACVVAWLLLGGAIVARAADQADSEASPCDVPAADGGAIDIGPELPEGRCASIGAPSAGWLVGGVQLEGSPRAHVRPGRNVGTPETVARLRAAVDAVHAQLKGTRRIPVGDISLEGGGPMSLEARPRSARSTRSIDLFRPMGYHKASRPPATSTSPAAPCSPRHDRCS